MPFQWRTLFGHPYLAPGKAKQVLHADALPPECRHTNKHEDTAEHDLGHLCSPSSVCGTACILMPQRYQHLRRPQSSRLPSAKVRSILRYPLWPVKNLLTDTAQRNTKQTTMRTRPVGRWASRSLISPSCLRIFDLAIEVDPTFIKPERNQFRR
jgi:hypothetical protein